MSDRVDKALLRNKYALKRMINECNAKLVEMEINHDEYLSTVPLPEQSEPLMQEFERVRTQMRAHLKDLEGRLERGEYTN